MAIVFVEEDIEKAIDSALEIIERDNEKYSPPKFLGVDYGDSYSVAKELWDTVRTAEHVAGFKVGFGNNDYFGNTYENHVRVSRNRNTVVFRLVFSKELYDENGIIIAMLPIVREIGVNLDMTNHEGENGRYCDRISTEKSHLTINYDAYKLPTLEKD